MSAPRTPTVRPATARACGGRPLDAGRRGRAGLTGTLLLLAQVTLLAAVVAAAAEGGLRQVLTAQAAARSRSSSLRLSFPLGVVLDLAATLSTALVAVILGVRLVGGTLGLRPALTVLLVPGLYAPIRKVGTLFHDSADGLAAAEWILDILERTGPGNGSGAVPDPRPRRSCSPGPTRDRRRPGPLALPRRLGPQHPASSRGRWRRTSRWAGHKPPRRRSGRPPGRRPRTPPAQRLCHGDRGRRPRAVGGSAATDRG